MLPRNKSRPKSRFDRVAKTRMAPIRIELVRRLGHNAVMMRVATTLFSLSVCAAITHPVLSGPAIKRVEESDLEQLIVTDTIPLTDAARECKKIRVVSIADLLGEAIRRITNEESVSSLFV